MRGISNNLIAILMIFLMLLSLIGTTLISYYAEEKVTSFGKATATVGVKVVDASGCGNDVCDAWETYSTCPADCPVPPVTPGTSPSGGSSSGGGGLPQPKFDVDPKIIKVQVKENDVLEYPLKVKNGNKAMNFTVDLQSLVNILRVNEPSFSLGPTEEKDLILTIVAGESIKPGIYTGNILIIGTFRDQSIKQLVNVIIEVETKRVIFDLTLVIPEEYKQIKPNSDLVMQITLFDMGRVGKSSVNLSYLIKDFKGDTVVESSDTMVVVDQVSFTKTLYIPDSPSGKYVASVTIKYGESLGTASDIFEIVGKEQPISPTFNKEFLLYLLILIFILVAIFVSVLYLQNKKLKNIEKIQKTKLTKTYKKYIKKKHTNKENIDMINKLNKQMDLLNKSYSEKYISKESYDKGKVRLKKMIDSLKKE